MPDNQGYMIAAYLLLGVLYGGYAAWSLRPASPVSRPAGLALTAIYTGLGGIGNGFFGVAFVLADPVTKWVSVLGFALILLGIAAFAATYGLWLLTPWGHSLARGLYIASVPLGLMAMVSDMTTGNVIRQVVGVGFACWILFYLSRPEIKSLFRPS